MGLFSRKPKVQDQALSELSQMFISLPDDPTPGADLLDAAKLDYSVESLGHVDDYREAMRQQQLDDDATCKLVLRAGAYVGEVIRRHTTGKTFHWLDYKDAAKLSSMIAEFGETLDSAAILWDGDGGFTFPLAKIMKYLDNGSEDSVKFFAHAMIQKSNEGAA